MNYLNNKTVLVAGGAGYVGTELINKFISNNVNVICLDLLIYGDESLNNFSNKKNFRFVKGDIRDWKLIKDITQNVDFVINLAAIVGDKPCESAPDSAVQINYNGNILLAEAAKKNRVKKFIFASTCSNYGISDPNSYANEESFLNPVSLYAETKIDSEKILKNLSTENFSTTSLRFATAFGISKRTRFDLTVNSFAFEALHNKKIIVFAENTWRPYIHVSDMANIIFDIIGLDNNLVSGQIYNAGKTSQNHTKKDLVKFLLELLPQTEIKFISSIDDRRDYRVSCKKIEKLIEMKNTKSVKKGFEEIINAFNQKLLQITDYNSNNLDAIAEFYKKNKNKLIFNDQK